MVIYMFFLQIDAYPCLAGSQTIVAAETRNYSVQVCRFPSQETRLLLNVKGPRLSRTVFPIAGNNTENFFATNRQQRVHLNRRYLRIVENNRTINEPILRWRS
jgi:hypothetical protein